MGRIMSNFDILVGLSQLEISRFVAEFHAKSGASENPFKGRKELEVLGLPAEIEWDVVASPEVVLERPDCATWLAAQGRDGLTNEEANRHCPKLPMLQLKFPQLDIAFGLQGDELQSGTSRDVIAHTILTFEGPTIGMELVALTVDQREFENADKQVFNLLVLPVIFDTAEQALSVIHLPDLSLADLPFNPLQVSQRDRYLLGATTLLANSSPLDIASVTVPQDPVFILLSDNVVNAALLNGFTANGPFIKEDSKDFNKLATLSYKAEGMPSAHVGTIEPLTINAYANMKLEATVDLTPLGIAMLVVAPIGCVISLFV